MPTSATGTTERATGRPARPPVHRGFTLIELLVVLVIFGIALGLVTVRLLPDSLALARREAQATALLLERAADDSESTGRVLAWHPGTAQATFETLNDAGDWQALRGDEDFGARALPGDLHWSALDFAGAASDRPATVAAVTDDAARRSGGLPGPTTGNRPPAAARVIFLPGQAAPEFSIELQAGAVRVQLLGDALGRVRVNTIAAGSGL